MRATGLGAGAGQAFAAERLHAHNRTNHVAVDIDIADMGGFGQRLRAAVDAGLDTQREAITQRVNLGDHIQRVTVPAHDLQHRAKDFGFDVGDTFHFEGMWCNQVCY